METTSNRTPTRCREWERQRRNKFNDALSKLCDIVKAILKSNNTSGKEIEDVQYPKIEIVQKAIICLNNCVLERTQLKSDILALQVQLEAEKQKSIIKKDASTQVCIRFNNRNKNSKHVKLLMVQKSKRSALKEKILTTNVTETPETTQKLPKLLPRFTENKGPENTFVVLPGSPYIFPQRPLLFPSVPPTILLVDPNMQTLNKSPIPMISRNSGEVTKTTMVNILPISAYSLSVTKSKKNTGKVKHDITKKLAKKTKSHSSHEALQAKVVPIMETELQVKEIATDKNENISSNIVSKEEVIQLKNNAKNATDNEEAEKVNHDKNDKNKTNITVSISKPSNKIDEAPNIGNKLHCTESIIKVTSVITTTNVEPKVTDSVKTTIENKTTSSALNKLSEDKDKENKLSNILEASLCDSAVDGGNARLELAEEFLAASPTAAFLMSFPLVSGNRADSPAEEPQNTVQASKDSQRRNEALPKLVTFFEKTSNNDLKTKAASKLQPTAILVNKQNQQQKPIDNITTKQAEATKTVNTAALTNVSTENPFLNLPMTSLISTSCTLTDTTFGIDFDCNLGKTTIASQPPTSYVSNSNLFYKSDPFSTVKNTIYSTSSISSSHEYNGLGLYPCAMEKYSSKNKSDFGNVEDNLMKIGSSRLTYDIDLGWSHKGFDFVNCTTAANAYNKDILTTASAPYSTAYNPFNPEFHVPLVSSSNKKDNTTTKSSSSFAESMTSFYSQPSNLWTDDAPFYTNSTIAKSLTTKHQNYIPVDHVQPNLNMRTNSTKHYESKQLSQTVDNTKHSNIGIVQPSSEKYTKKSPNKMHINWMTSEIRPMQNNCNIINTDIKAIHKPTYGHLDATAKKHDLNESNYFPIHNFSTQSTQEEFQVWPSTRPLGTTEISIEPPPINLPTLVGDLALGPHDKKKTADSLNRTVPPSDVQNCGNFLSVTQLMNRTTDMSSRHHGPHNELAKSMPTKQNLNVPHFSNDGNRKNMISRLESHVPQPCYVFNEPKPMHSYDNMPQFSTQKTKTNNKTDKSAKTHKNNNYSAEALIRGGSCTQKVQDSSNAKFMMPAQKYNDYNPQDSSVAQVSHFPPIIDYSDNSYAGQQYSGTTLYNSTTNTISNSFYSNFMPGSTNLMSGNYAGGPFTGDFIDYNQTPECSYTNHKYEEFKMRNNATAFQSEKVPANYKSSRRETTAKHKLECSKKETNKKYQSKRAKPNNEVEDWNDPSHLLWQNKSTNKRHSNFISEEIPFPNYVGNQMPTQYQPELFNSHLMPSNVQSVGHNTDRSLSSFPATSRANFNLSTIFPEITMKVQ